VHNKAYHDDRIIRETGLEARVAHIVGPVLDGLGYAPVYRYEKYRTSYAWGDLAIELDETPIGCFVELEGPSEAIDRAAAGLGSAPEQWITDSYLDLHERAAAERGEARGDLLFPAGGAEP